MTKLELENKQKLQTELKIKIVFEQKRRCFFIKGRGDWSEYKTINKKLAHRQAYLICNGPLILNKVICHNCDRPGCINPEHLFQGTHGDNFMDALNKGRAQNISTQRKNRNREWNKLKELDNWKQLRRFAGE